LQTYAQEEIQDLAQLSLSSAFIRQHSNSKIFYLPSVFGGRFLLPEKNIYGIIHLK